MVDISFKNRTGIKPEVLSAVIGADSFFYGFFSSDNQLLESGHYEISDFRDNTLIANIKNDMYSIAGLKVKLAFSGKPYLHSSSEDGGQLLKFFPAFANKYIDSDTLTDQEIVVDFGLSKTQHAFADQILGDNNYTQFHISTVLANYYYPYSAKKIVAYIGPEKLHIMYASDQQFVYYNQFTCINENDYLYFVLLAAKELKLDMTKTTLEVSGNVDVESPIYRKFAAYCEHVEVMRSSILVVSDLRFRATQHYYLDLFATSICV